MRWVRWLLLIPGVWLAWSVALVSGLAVHSALATLCPPEQVALTLCLGSVAASVMGLLTHAYAELVTALAAGGLTTAWLLRRKLP